MTDDDEDDRAGFTSSAEPAQFLQFCAFGQMERVLDINAVTPCY
jgi:hypothetical protein